MPSRRILPQRRTAETFDIETRAGHHATITIGRYEDGQIGEIFVNTKKSGSELDATARDAAVILSIAIQYGVPVQTIQHAITREADGAPSTIIGAVLDSLT